jgi:uncharacterized protein with beta-barrel porin domain
LLFQFLYFLVCFSPNLWAQNAVTVTTNAGNQSFGSFGYAVTDLNALGDGTLTFSSPANIVLALPIPSFSNNVTFTGGGLSYDTLNGQDIAPAQLFFQKSFTQSDYLSLLGGGTATGLDASVTASAWTINPGASVYMAAGTGAATSGTNGVGLTGFSGGDASVTVGTLVLNSIAGAVLNGGTGGSLSDVNGTGDEAGSGGGSLMAGNALTLTGANISLNGGLGGDATDTGTGTPTGGDGGTASVSFMTLSASSHSNLTLTGGNGGYADTAGDGGSASAQLNVVSISQSQLNLQGHDGRGGINGGGAGGSASVSLGTLSEILGSTFQIMGGNGNAGPSSAGDGGSAFIGGGSASVTASQFNITGGSGGSPDPITGSPGIAGNGGVGGNAGVSLNTLTADSESSLKLIGGNGGIGGSQTTAGQGGDGGSVTLILISLSEGTSVQYYVQAGTGGGGGSGTSGGNGGNGGDAFVTISNLTLGAGSLFSATSGAGGAGGSTGVNGTGGICTADIGSVTMTAGSTFIAAGTNANAAVSALNGNGFVSVGGLQVLAGTYNGVINGNSMLVPTAGNFTFTGTANLTNGLSIIGGNFGLGIGPSANAVINGNVNITNGAGTGVLWGYGKINGTVTNSAFVDPYGPSSIQTASLIITQYTQTSSGVLGLFVNPGDNQTSDLIVSGANLSGTLSTSWNLGSNFGFRDRYQIISGGPITGTFNTVNIVTGMYPVVLYGPNTVTLVMIKDHAAFSTYAETDNETAVGGTLDASLPFCSNSLAVKLGELSSLGSGQSNVLNQLGGVIYTALPGALMDQVQYGDELIFDHLGSSSFSGPNLAKLVLPPQTDDSISFAAKQGKRTSAKSAGSSEDGFWLESEDSFGSSGPTSQVTAFNLSNYGFLGGYDFSLNKQFKLGLLGGYLRSGVNPTDNSATADIIGAQFGLTAKGTFDIFSVGLLGGYVADHYNITRSVIIGSDANSLNGTYNGGQIQAALQMEVDLSDPGSTFRPFWGFLYDHLTENAFTETGSDSMALSLPAQSFDSARLFAGLEEDLIFPLGKHSQLTPILRASVSKDLASLNPGFQTSFNGAPGNPFQIGGISPDGTDYDLGGGLNLKLGTSFNLFANFDGHFSSTDSLNLISGGMTVGL